MSLLDKYKLNAKDLNGKLNPWANISPPEGDIVKSDSDITEMVAVSDHTYMPIDTVFPPMLESLTFYKISRNLESSDIFYRLPDALPNLRSLSLIFCDGLSEAITYPPLLEELTVVAQRIFEFRGLPPKLRSLSVRLELGGWCHWNGSPKTLRGLKLHCLLGGITAHLRYPLTSLEFLADRGKFQLSCTVDNLYLHRDSNTAPEITKYGKVKSLHMSFKTVIEDLPVKIREILYSCETLHLYAVVLLSGVLDLTPYTNIKKIYLNYGEYDLKVNPDQEVIYRECPDEHHAIFFSS